jgi:hypothetical protein
MLCPTIPERLSCPVRYRDQINRLGQSQWNERLNALYLHLVERLHEVMVDLVRYNRIVLISRVRGDEVSDPSSGCAQFACKTRTKIRRVSCGLSALLLRTLGSVLDKVQICANLATGDVINIQRVQVGVDDSHQTRERVLKKADNQFEFSTVRLELSSPFR